MSGKLFAESKQVKIGGQAMKPGLAEQLWARSVEMTSAKAASAA